MFDVDHPRATQVLQLSKEQVKYICEEASRAGTQGQRAEIFACEVARASAGELLIGIFFQWGGVNRCMEYTSILLHACRFIRAGGPWRWGLKLAPPSNTSTPNSTWEQLTER